MKAMTLIFRKDELEIQEKTRNVLRFLSSFTFNCYISVVLVKILTVLHLILSQRYSLNRDFVFLIKITYVYKCM